VTLPLHAADPTGVQPIGETTARGFATAVDNLSALDPQSPQTLNARLAYADYLAKAEGGDCRLRLASAQSQLDIARASPAIGIALPWGLALEASVEYQIHFARASCGSGAGVREQELRAALEFARRAVDLYRDALDAVSMVAMQFNTGVVYRSLGDNDAAIAALGTTLELDREYGFEEDARDNYLLLLQWSGAQAGPDQVAARMEDFPNRSTTLNFGWFESNANVTLETDHSQFANGELLHVRSVRTAQRQVRKGLAGWVVSYQAGDAHYDFGTPPNQDPSTQGFANALARMLLQLHDFSLARNGDFDHAKREFRFGSRVRADASVLTRDLASSGDPTALMRLIDQAVDAALSPDATAAMVAEDYHLQTGTWIGATLEQGVWYDMAVPLSLPLAPNLFLMHKIQFAFTRPVPCTPDSTDQSCVEIVLRATPEPASLEAILEALARKSHLRHGQLPRLWSAACMRLVTDPSNLQPYNLDSRHHSYWSTGASDPNQSLIEFERTVLASERISRVAVRQTSAP
jgi:tetratricopeptide (TPR) repeat protein